MEGIPQRLARVPKLEVHEARDGLVAFDPATDRVHHLNATSSVNAPPGGGGVVLHALATNMSTAASAT